MALSLSDGITADDDIYKRLVRDIAAIRTVDPRMRTITYAAPDSGALLVTPVSSKQLLFKWGLYRGWNCLNRHFRVNRITFQSGGYALLEFNGRYNLDQLGELYSRLDGVRGAEPDLYANLARSENLVSIYVTPDPDVWRYVFVGACRANDIECGAHYFVVSPDGTVKHVETWRAPPHNTPEMEPSWMKDVHAAYVRAAEKRYRESAYRNRILTR